jgi:hypothetical protein
VTEGTPLNWRTDRPNRARGRLPTRLRARGFKAVAIRITPSCAPGNVWLGRLILLPSLGLPEQSWLHIFIGRLLDD